MQLGLRLLHRPFGARARGKSAPGRDRRGGRGARRDGVREVTLLGQNVNSYGRDLGSEVDADFALLLRAVDALVGIDRIRFTSPHPKDFRPEVIQAIAECKAVCEHVHLPLQSGSTGVLKRMRRTYSRDRYLKLVDELGRPFPIWHSRPM